MDSTAAAVTFGSGFVITAFMQFFKTLIERFIKPADPMHDSAVQITAILIGVIAFVVHAATLSPLVATSFWEAAGQGALAGFGSIASFHVATASMPTVMTNQTTTQQGVQPLSIVPNGAQPTLVPATSEHVDVVSPIQPDPAPTP